MTTDRTPAQAELSEGDKLTAESVVWDARAYDGNDPSWVHSESFAIDAVRRLLAQETAALRDELKREIEAHGASQREYSGLLQVSGVEAQQLRASRDAATAELAHVRVELVACQAERDAAMDRVRELNETLLALVNRP